MKMNWWHEHRWVVAGHKEVRVYDSDKRTGERPVRIETHVSMTCKVCNEPRIKVLDGMWSNAG